MYAPAGESLEKVFNSRRLSVVKAESTSLSLSHSIVPFPFMLLKKKKSQTTASAILLLPAASAFAYFLFSAPPVFLFLVFACIERRHASSRARSALIHTIF